MHISRFTWIALLLWPLGAIGQAADDAARRAQLAEQRASAEERYRDALKACDGAFQLTACVDQARRDHRREVDRLDAERAALDTTARRQRAEERSRRIDEKQRSAARRASEAAAASAPLPRAQEQAIAPPAAQDTATSKRRDLRAAAAEREAAASARQMARNRRITEAEAHAAAVSKRNAERAARRTPATPLPGGAASAVPLR